jgi:hypothetical protein
LRIGGACLALAPGCEYLTLFPAAVIGLWFLAQTARSFRVRAALELAAGALLPIVMLSAYHTAAFGVPWRTGYSFMTNPEFAAGHATGLLGIHLPRAAGIYGLLWGVQRGLFYLSPLAAFGVMFGIAHVRRRRDFAAAAGLAALAILFWLNAGYYMWWGGAAAGARHLIPGLPFLAVGVALGLRARWRWVRNLTVVLGIVGMANFFAITAAGVEAPEHGDILFRHAWRRLFVGDVGGTAGGSNLGLKLGLTGASSLLPLFAWWAGGFMYLLRQFRRTRLRVRDGR